MLTTVLRTMLHQETAWKRGVKDQVLLALLRRWADNMRLLCTHGLFSTWNDQ